jgi:dTDP-glucose 4,6-dehydratase
LNALREGAIRDDLISPARARPYQYPEKLIPKTIIFALNDHVIPIYGSGNNVRDWMYVVDHCDAITQIMERGNPGEIYNISANNEVTNLELVEDILRRLGKSRDLITFVTDRPGHDFRYSLNSTKIQTELAWQPQHSFTAALAQTVQWYVDHQSWWEPLIRQSELLAKR